MARLVVENLSVGRGGLRLLAGVGFDLMPGNALVLRGPNGSGKTTLLRTIAGLTPALSGRIDAPRDAIVFAGHSDGIKAQLTVAENLRFWARIFGTTHDAEAAAAFDLTTLTERRAGELSAGQRRRLSLARVAVAQRSIWCLDEPTVSLDAENVARFADIVAQHLTAGGTALLTTHIDLGLKAETLDVTAFTAPSFEPEGALADPFGGDAPL
ncbi:MAG: heme ABC exporter ATP-binding protein CcmA [Pseudomonadota bacterium]